MPRKTLQIEFPRLGVVRRYAYRDMADMRAPYPTPWSVNCRLQGPLSSRMRGGSWEGGDSSLLSWSTLSLEALAALTLSELSELKATWADSRSGDYVYRDRAITFSGGVITAARQGDSTDTALSADLSDSARPIIFQLAEADATGDDVVAVVPHKDSFLVCFTAGETWVLSGDPATGTLRRVSDEVGIVAETAWCVNHDTVYFLSEHGLYSVGADGSGLKALSEDAVPEELTGVSDDDCVLTYNHADRGVYCYLSDAAVSWFYDTARDQFWPFTTETNDSHVLLGPMRIGGPDGYGRILRLYGITAESSAAVTWRLVPGDTAEEAAANGKAAITASLAGGDFSSYVHSSGAWTAGINNSAYPRTRAQWIVLWLAASGNWAYETAAMTAVLSGKWR